MTAGSTGRSRRVAIVASAGEIKAASKSMPQAVSRSAGAAENNGRKSEVKHEGKHAMPQSRQANTVQRAPAKLQHEEQRAPNAHEPSPAKSHGQATRVPAQPRQQTQQAPTRAEARPSEPRRAAAPALHRQEPPARAKAHPSAPQASVHSAKSAPPKHEPRDKAVKKDKNNNP